MTYSFHADVNYQLNQFAPEQQAEQDEKPVIKQNENANSTSSTMAVSDTEKPAGEFKVDRGYNVPLVATALTDGSGIAIDHRVNTDFNFGGKTHDITPFIALHELTELPHMQNLMETGMSPQDAYHEAHDKIAIPIETAASKAYAVRNGYDPDEFHEAYKQHVRDQTAIAAQPSDQNRHPLGHTTQYGLDETEGAIDKAVAAKQEQLLDKDPTVSMAGLGSETADYTKFQEAYRMSQKGISPEEIFKATRWFKGGEGQWRYELPNAEASIKTDKLTPHINKYTGETTYYLNKPTTLGEVLDHPELYKAYPHFKDIPLHPVNIFQELEGVKGSYSPPTKEEPSGSMRTGRGNPGEIISNLLHETQHAIQNYEGFEKGGNPTKFEHPELRQFQQESKIHEGKIKAELEANGFKESTNQLAFVDRMLGGAGNPGDKYYKSMREILPGESVEEYERLRDDYPQLFNRFKLHQEVKKNIQELENIAYEKYRSLAGEVEARNVQTRYKDKIMAKPPWETEDVPLSQQMFRQGSTINSENQAVGADILTGGMGPLHQSEAEKEESLLR